MALTPLKLQKLFWNRSRAIAGKLARETDPEARRLLTGRLRESLRDSLVLSNLRGRSQTVEELRVKGELPKSLQAIPGETPEVAESRVVQILRAKVPALRETAETLNRLYMNRAFFVTEQLGPILETQVEKLRELIIRRARGEGLAPRPTIGVKGLLQEARDTINLTKFRLETVFRTNIGQAFMDGVLEQQEEPEVKAAIVYREYISSLTKTTRTTHAAIHGFLAPSDDPVWQTIWPLNGFNCLCHPPRPIFAPEAKRRGLVEGGRPIGRRFSNSVQRDLIETGFAMIAGKIVQFPDKGWAKASVIIAA